MGVEGSASPNPKVEEGRLSVGRNGGAATVGAVGCSSSGNDARALEGLCVEVERPGEPFVISESMENRDTGFPSESRENRSGCGIGLGGGGGAACCEDEEDALLGEGTGLSES